MPAFRKRSILCNEDEREAARKMDTASGDRITSTAEWSRVSGVVDDCRKIITERCEALSGKEQA